MEIKKSVMFLLVFIVIGTVLISASNFLATKLLIGNTLRGSCFDTDGGRVDSIYVKGTVSGIMDNGASFERTDYCVNTYQLKEYRCDLSTSTNFNIGSDSVNGNGNLIYCNNGCLNGACIR
ncbi:MAG: hypothetical protein PHF86_05885 [Candidatus Nanoarchaeia archaeon]|nr:hypothetical protein [Candidatus Nanoarchaeia archaeon]